jgi:molybdopterin-guanine dinucleotide biosynthesis protein A
VAGQRPPPLDAMLAGTGKHSMRAFAGRIGARAVQLLSFLLISIPRRISAAERRSHGL